ncbi:uncharacterized protein LOC112090374 [Morus notabilis]|uniref:uncharacterized protein LOC112090374 n=1 Tax=Morus notabilis TaxID=981085 RepID=UPI000CED5255|nr:uncharacterized protein LOC112090374 [Morus notabilis]
MWSGGPSNPNNNGPPKYDSDDDYILGVADAAVFYTAYLEHPLSTPRNNSHYTCTQRLSDLLNGHEMVIYNKIRMGSDCFRKLSWLLEQKNLLRSTRNMSVDEQLIIFLTIVCQNESNRETQHQWQHLGATISKYFMVVLNAIYRLRHDFIKPPDFNRIDPLIEASRSKYRHWFDNYVGALDGTHVPCVPPPENAEFTYMLAGREGSAHDARVLESTNETPEKKFHVPPTGKFYLVDSGYANTGCFLAPYRGCTYHLQEYRARRGRPRSERELFNYTHSSIRNCIEQAFGVWKARFCILKIINNYAMQKQTRIPIACAVIHDFIRMYQHDDSFINQYLQDGVPVSEIDPLNTDEDVNQNHNPNRSMEGPRNTASRREMGLMRDKIARTTWQAHGGNNNR